MIARESIVAEAATWIGTPWLHQGRLKGVGADCIGLVGMSALACGVPGAAEWRAEPSLHNYGRTPDPKVLIAACDRFMDRIAIAAATLADVLVMAFAREPQHFALISRVDPIYLIHAYAQRRRAVENGLAIFGAKVLRAYRFRGVA